MATELTPKEYMQLSEALAVSLRLLLLDRVWTREAQRASVASTRESSRVEELDGVTNEMVVLLKQVQSSASVVSEIAERNGTLLQERFDEFIGGKVGRGVEPARADVIAKRLRHHVNERAKGSAALYLNGAAQLLADRGDDEAKQIRAELGKLRGVDPSDGDMSEETQEAVGAIALGAGLMFGPEAAGAVIVVAEIIDCLT